VGCLLVAGLALLGGGCGLSNDVSTAITGPLLALKDSDTVVETNLKTVVTTLQAGEPASAAGLTVTSGPSTGYSVISVSTPTGQPTVIVGWNQLSQNCLGVVTIAAGGVPVLGESQPGTYYFWDLHVSSPSCSAASFAATPSTPTGWPSGDPSSSGWPLP
jgi:hypothetical protein